MNETEICQQCGESFILRPDCDSTGFCDLCAQDMVAEMGQPIMKLRADLSRLKALLKRCEWASGIRGAYRCPICGSLWDSDEHAADCALAAAIKDAP